MWIIVETIFNLCMLFYYIVESLVVRFIPIRFRSKDISGQIALVTGAGGGIGRLIALGLSNQGKWFCYLFISNLFIYLFTSLIYKDVKSFAGT